MGSLNKQTKKMLLLFTDHLSPCFVLLCFSCNLVMKKSNLFTRAEQKEKIFAKDQKQSCLKIKIQTNKTKQKQKTRTITPFAPPNTLPTARNCKFTGASSQPSSLGIYLRHGQARVKIFTLSSSLCGQCF